MARHHYLIPFAWNQSDPDSPFWAVPHAPLGMVDLRPLSAQAAAGGIPQGYAFAVYDKTIVDPTAIYLGDSLENNLSITDKSAMKTLLNLPPEASVRDKLLDALWNVLGVQADPKGEARCKPIMPTAAGRLELHLGGYSLVKSQQLRPMIDAEWENILAVLQEDYRRIRAAGGPYRKVLSYWRKQYGTRDHRVFIPPGLPDEGLLPDDTTITENFNTADSDTLGPQLTWTESTDVFAILTNQATKDTAAGNTWARADTDLSSDNHYSQALMPNVQTNGSRMGVMFRKDGTATNTYYLATWDAVSGANNDLQELHKRVAGTLTTLATLSTEEVADGDTLKGEVNGSSLTLYRNGVSKVTVTDTAITGNLRCGLSGHTGTGQLWDDFEAADLVTFDPSTTLIHGQIGGAAPVQTPVAMVVH